MFEAGLALMLQRSGPEVGWRGIVEVDGAAHHVVIRYPAYYPGGPPFIWETEPFNDQLIDARSTHHQLTTGALCLYGAGEQQNAWSAHHTVVDLLERYREFRRMANNGEHIDDHGGPSGDFVGQATARPVLLSPGQAAVLGMPGWGRIWLHPLWTQQAWVAGRVDHRDGLSVVQDAARWPIHPGVPSASIQPVPWVKVNAATWRSTFPDWASVQAVVPSDAPRRPDGMVVLVRDLRSQPEHVERPAEGHEHAVVGVGLSGLQLQARWVMPLDTPMGPRLVSGPVEEVDLQAALFARIDGALTSRSALDGWTVVLVGLGSLGGSIAVHLARSGVSRFVLYDPDVLRPENVMRHVAGRTMLYGSKVDAVRALILDRNPWAEVDTHPSSPLWDASGGASAAFDALLLRDQTLLVITVAEHETEHALNARAVAHGRPAIYASVLGPGDHGRVFRVLPGESPCYSCVVDAQQESPGSYFRVGNEHTAPAGYAQPGMPGLGVDVEQVALHASRFVLQTLDRLGGGALGYADAPGHHLVWTNRGGDGFDLALQARWEPYHRRPMCAVCSSHNVRDDPVVSARIEQLQRELRDPSRLARHVPILHVDTPPPSQGSAS